MRGARGSAARAAALRRRVLRGMRREDEAKAALLAGDMSNTRAAARARSSGPRRKADRESSFLVRAPLGSPIWANPGTGA